MDLIIKKKCDFHLNKLKQRYFNSIYDLFEIIENTDDSHTVTYIICELTDIMDYTVLEFPFSLESLPDTYGSLFNYLTLNTKLTNIDIKYVYAYLNKCYFDIFKLPRNINYLILNILKYSNINYDLLTLFLTIFDNILSYNIKDLNIIYYLDYRTKKLCSYFNIYGVSIKKIVIILNYNIEENPHWNLQNIPKYFNMYFIQPLNKYILECLDNSTIDTYSCISLLLSKNPVFNMIYIFLNLKNTYFSSTDILKLLLSYKTNESDNEFIILQTLLGKFYIKNSNIIFLNTVTNDEKNIIYNIIDPTNNTIEEKIYIITNSFDLK